MKKMVLLSFLLLFLIASFSFAQIPSPFDKIKQMALKGNSIGGIHELNIEINEDGQQIVYVFGYAEPDNIYGAHESMGIAKQIGENIEAYGYCLVCAKFYVKGGNFPEDKASEGAYKLFRELVSKNLI